MRPSPTESATEFKVGFKRKGNDSNMWAVSENKNLVKSWKKVSTSLVEKASANAPWNNKKEFLRLLKSWGKDVSISSCLAWAKLLMPISQKLISHGIVLFPYPMGYQFVDDAENDACDYMHDIPAIRDLPYIFHMAPSKEGSMLCLKHDLHNKKNRDLVHAIIEKFIVVKWNGKDSEAICIAKNKDGFRKTINPTRTLANKLRKELPGKFKVISNKKIQFAGVSSAVVDRALIKYGLHHSIEGLPEDYEDAFYLSRDYIHVNFTSGIGADLYKTLTE